MPEKSLDEIFGPVSPATPPPAPGKTPKKSLDEIFGPVAPAPGGGDAPLTVNVNAPRPLDTPAPAAQPAAYPEWFRPGTGSPDAGAAEDYDKGAPFNIRVQLHRADNPREAELVMKRYYGDGNYGQDKHGNWWGMQDGKRTAVFPRGSLVSRMTDTLGAGTVAGTWPMAGAVAGGIAGGMFGGGVGAIPGAMAGAAAGKGVDDLIKWTQGLFDKSANETVGGMSREGAVAGVFEGAAPVARQAHRGVQNVFQKWLGTTPETRALGRRALGAGARPPIATLAPAAKALEYRREFRNKLSSDPQEPARAEMVDKNLRRIMETFGFSGEEAEKTLARAYRNTSEVSTRDAGEKIVGRLAGIRKGLEQSARTLREEASARVADVDRTIRDLARPTPGLARDVSDAIVTERRRFGQEMAEHYARVDQMTGQVPVVPTAEIRETARAIQEVMPPTQLPPIIRHWAGENAEERITFEQAHALRTTFREMAEVMNLGGPGQRVGISGDLANAVDFAISSSEGALGQRAARALRTVDQAYAVGISRFNDATINSLVKNVRSGLIPEPEQVARLLFHPEKINTAREVFRMVPETVRADALRADMQNMVNSVSRPNPQGGQTLDGMALLKMLEKRAKVLEAFYPPAIVRDLRSSARSLAAYRGQVDITALHDPTALNEAIRNALKAEQEAERFARQDALKALSTGSPQNVDAAARIITQPGAEAITEAAIRRLGNNSSAVKTLRRYALEDLITAAIDTTASKGLKINPNKLATRLGNYTEKQQTLLFPKGVAADLNTLKDDLQFLFPHAQGWLEGPGQAAATVKGKLGLVGLLYNPKTYSAWITYISKHISGYVADHPWLLRYLANEVEKGNSVKARTVLSYIKQDALRAATQGPGNGRPPGDPTNVQQPFRPAAPQKAARPGIKPLSYGGTE